MPDPVNYSLTAPPPAAAFTAGLETGGAMRSNALQDQGQQLALQNAEIAQRQAAQQRADLAALAANKNPTAQDYANLVFKYPALKDSMRQGWDALTQEKQQSRVQQAAPVFAALQAGRNDLAQTLMKEHVDALKNSGGDPKEIAAGETWLKLITDHPDVAKHSSGIMLASALGPEKFEGMFGRAKTEARADAQLPGQIAATAATTGQTVATTAETVAKTAALPVVTAANVRKTDAEIRDLDSQITTRAERLGLDADKLRSEVDIKMRELEAKTGKLEPDARKIVNDTAVSAVAARATAAQARGLADQFAQADVAGGLRGSAWEKLKEFSGQQDYISNLRREYTKIRSEGVLKALPQGPASDKDIAFASKGFLPDTANAAEIASFLRGMAKIQDFQAKMDDARGEWVAAVGHSGKATKDIDIGGVKVPAGYTLSAFLQRTLANVGSTTEPPAPGTKTGYQKYDQTGGASGSF